MVRTALALKLALIDRPGVRFSSAADRFVTKPSRGKPQSTSIRTSVHLNRKPAGKSRFASLVSFRNSTQLPNAEPVVADIGLIWEKRNTAKSKNAA